MSALANGRVVVLGGGVAGLASAYYLARSGRPVTVVERGPRTGGLCGSFEQDGFTLDYGPHKLYSVLPGILDEIRRLLGDELLEHRKRNRVRLLGRYLDYPLRLGNLLPLLGPVRAAKLGLTYAQAIAGGLLGRKEPRTYEEYVVQRFGRGVYELVFAPLAWKVWGDPGLLAAELAQARIPAGGAADLILRLLKLKANTADVDAPFFYYPRGGFGRFPARLEEEIRKLGGEVLTQAEPVALRRDGARVTAVDVRMNGETRTIPSDLLVSSVPLTTLARILFPEDPSVDEDARALRFRSLILVYLFLRRPRVTQDHWLFFPERQFPFSRVFEQKAMSETMGPPDRTAVCCDFTCDEGDAVWTMDDAGLVKQCGEAIQAADLARADDIEGGFTRRFSAFYPMYTVDYRQRLGKVYDRLWAAENLLLTGRIGMFNYNNSDHCLDMGRFIAEEVERGRAPRDIWSDLERRVRAYRIVD